MRTMRAVHSGVVVATMSIAVSAGCGAEGSRTDAASSRSAASSGGREWATPVKIPELVEGSINSIPVDPADAASRRAADENNPALSADGRTLYFVRGGNTIWVSRWDAGAPAWGVPVPLPAVDAQGRACINFRPSPNSANNAPSLSADGQTFFFASNRGGGSFDLFVARRAVGPEDPCGGWEHPVPLADPVAGDLAAVNTTEFVETAPEPVQAAEAGMSHLYFGRQQGGIQRVWTVPIAHEGAVRGDAVLVAELTPGTAAAIGPSVRMDRREIFFHSGRPDGGALGAADIWTSTRQNVHSAWDSPTNVGPSLNTPFTDSQPNLSRDARTMLFISNRPLDYDTNRDAVAETHTDIWMSSRSPAAKP